ncbi:MAG: hypothetical protein P8Y44_11955, partial [Acidobacteriota bacterium]
TLDPGDRLPPSTLPEITDPSPSPVAVARRYHGMSSRILSLGPALLARNMHSFSGYDLRWRR